MNATLTQLVRYGIVGVASNLALYLLYLLLTFLGVPPKVAMTLGYVVGVAQTFIFNKRWSFTDSGAAREQFSRYCATYALAYFVQLAGFIVLIDFVGLQHQAVAAGLIIPVALFIFALQKLWVFQPTSASSISR